MVVCFNKEMRKLLIILCLGICFVSCSKAQNGKESTMKEYQAKDITKLINKGKAVLFVNAIIKGDLDFSDIDDREMTAPNSFVAHVPSTIYFQSCVFLGDVKGNGYKEINGKKIPVKVRFTRDVQFMDCDFRKNVDFNDAEFQASANFSKSAFRGETQFNNILCMGHKNQWWELEADSTFMMCGSTFRGDLNLMDAQFKQDASLQGINVNNLQISNLKADGRLDLSNANINGFLLFNYGNCGDDVQLSFGKFDGRTDIIGTTFNGRCEMERSLFYGVVKLDRTAFKGGLNTEEAHFILTPNTEETSFVNDSIPSFMGFKMNQ